MSFLSMLQLVLRSHHFVSSFLLSPTSLTNNNTKLAKPQQTCRHTPHIRPEPVVVLSARVAKHFYLSIASVTRSRTLPSLDTVKGEVTSWWSKK